MITIIIPGEPVAWMRAKPQIMSPAKMLNALITYLSVRSTKATKRAAMGRAMAQIKMVTPTKMRKYKEVIAWTAKGQMRGRPLMDGPLVVTVDAYRRKGMLGKVTSRIGSKSRTQWDDAEAGRLRPMTIPDFDNYVKMIDALNGVVWTDDARVVKGTGEKYFSSTPRLEIRVSAWTDAHPDQ